MNRLELAGSSRAQVVQRLVRDGDGGDEWLRWRDAGESWSSCPPRVVVMVLTLAVSVNWENNKNG